MRRGGGDEREMCCNNSVKKASTPHPDIIFILGKEREQREFFKENPLLGRGTVSREKTIPGLGPHKKYRSGY